MHWALIGSYTRLPNTHSHFGLFWWDWGREHGTVAPQRLQRGVGLIWVWDSIANMEALRLKDSSFERTLRSLIREGEKLKAYEYECRNGYFALVGIFGLRRNTVKQNRHGEALKQKKKVLD